MLYKNFLIAVTLGLSTLVTAHKQALDRPCGFKIAPCPSDTKCVPNSPHCTNLNRCLGTCVFKNQYRDCGGRRPNPPKCRKRYTCIDDPRIRGSCGICVSKKAPTCGGFLVKTCPKGLWCYDDPRDDCDPENGGADCIGICL